MYFAKKTTREKYEAIKRQLIQLKKLGKLKPSEEKILDVITRDDDYHESQDILLQSRLRCEKKPTTS